MKSNHIRRKETMATETKKETVRGRPRPETPPEREPTPSERRAELTTEAEQTGARLRHARTRANTLRNSGERTLKAELSGRLPEHAQAKLAAVTLQLREEVANWLRSLAGQSGDPKAPPVSAAVAFLLSRHEDEYRAWLAEQLAALAADPDDLTFSARDHKQIESEIAKVREQIVEADAEVQEAEEAQGAVISQLRRLDGGRLR